MTVKRDDVTIFIFLFFKHNYPKIVVGLTHIPKCHAITVVISYFACVWRVERSIAAAAVAAVGGVSIPKVTRSTSLLLKVTTFFFLLYDLFNF